MIYQNRESFNLLLVIVIAAIIFAGCKNDNDDQLAIPQNDSTTIDSIAKGKAYFPVMDYIKSEIRYVDSLPVGIRKFVISGNSTDSSYIRLDEFHEYANTFLSPELDPAVFTTNYTESSFYDRSTKSSTFFYQAKNDNAPIKRIDVQSRPDEVYDKVFNIYMERVQQLGDTLVIKKMTWKPGRQLQVIESKTSIQETQDMPIIRQVKIVWDNWEEE
jgi:hypothetical protein